MAARRTYGTGRIFIKHRSYYGRWWTPGGGYTNRKLGPVRKPGTSEGLTKRQAERRLRELMGTIYDTSQPYRTVAVAGALFTEHLQAKGRSRSHLETVESHLRVHLVPFFGDRPFDRIDEAHVTAMVAQLRRSGRAPKTVRNVLSTLHSVLDHSLRLRWITLNPCRFVDGPDLPSTAEVRYLDPGELETLLRDGIPDDDWGLLERPLYLMAAMTGLRQGELLGLRWRDIDWLACKVRVRQSYVRGEFKPPNPNEEAARCHSLLVPQPTSSGTFRRAPSNPTRIWFSRILTPAARLTARTCASGFNAPASGRRYGPSASTIYATHSAPAWRPRARSHCAPFKSGWATAIPRRR